MIAVDRQRLTQQCQTRTPNVFRQTLDPYNEVSLDGELHVRPRRDVLKRIQAMLRPYAPSEGSVADELIADRRTEAARD